MDFRQHELDRVQAAYDWLDRRIEHAGDQATKDRLSALREQWADYEKLIHRRLRVGRDIARRSA